MIQIDIVHSYVPGFNLRVLDCDWVSLCGSRAEDIGVAAIVFMLLSPTQLIKAQSASLRTFVERSASDFDIDLPSFFLISHARPRRQIISNRARLVVTEAIFVLDN